MRIGIDCRFASTPSGLGRFARELVTHLLKREDGIEYTLFVRSEDESWLPENYKEDFKKRVTLRSPAGDGSRQFFFAKSLTMTPAGRLEGRFLEAPTLKTAHFPHYSFSEQILFPHIIKQSGIDLFFSPHFNVPLRCPVPFIVTIHDLILHEFPNEAPLWKRLAYRWQMHHAIRNSAHIISVSQYTADEIRKRYSLPPLSSSLPVGERKSPQCSLPPRGRVRERGKMSIIHEGISPLFSPQSPAEQERILKKYHIQIPFFLYVGSSKSHKNVDLLKQAARKAGVRLICVPEFTGNVSDDDLPALYSAATAFVTASLAEGFCLPAVEALACGCPVIASCRSAIPEITRGYATLIEPTLDAFVQAMRSPPPRPNPIRLYEWEEAAEKTAQVLIKLCHGEEPPKGRLEPWHK